MVAVFKYRISTLMARPFQRRTCAFTAAFSPAIYADVGEKKKERRRARGNTYDFIILTLIHIHRAATLHTSFRKAHVFDARHDDATQRDAADAQNVMP